jgi:hypothetical protein
MVDGIMDMMSAIDGASPSKSSEAGDSVVEIPDEARVEPASKRQRSGYNSKVGIGVLGMVLASVHMLLGDAAEKLLKKLCSLCKCRLGDSDPVNAHLTRAWHKPRYEGKLCAYCGVAKGKLWPHIKDTKLVVDLISTKQEERVRFDKYLEQMIEAYTNGDKAAKNLDSAPKETVEKETEFNMETSVKGRMKLYTTYKQKHGDPATNGLGHTLTKARWKDGSVQEVVLIPFTLEDEMDCSWNHKVGHKHRTEIHNGELTENQNQLAQLFADLRQESGNSRLTGQALVSASSSGRPVSAAGGSGKSEGSLAGSPDNKKASTEDPDDDDDDEGEEVVGSDGLLDMLMDMGDSAGKQRGDVSVPGKTAAKAKSKANAKTGASTAPPPLKVLGGGVKKAALGKVVGQASGNAGVDAIEKGCKANFDKVSAMVTEFVTSQKASVLAMDKKFFKTCKTL